MNSDRAKTGIAELDKMLRGGFMRGDTVLLAGSAGTGKTTLALQFLVSGATEFGEYGIFVTFEQMPDQIYRDALNFGWDLRKLEQDRKLRLICTSPDLITGEGASALLDSPTREMNASRIVIDSISHLQMFLPDKGMRLEAYRLVNYFKTKGLTTLLTSESHEISGGSLTITGTGISFLVDCIMLLRHVEIESSMKKAITVLKMRGSDHDKQLREFEITSQGIRLASPFSQYEGIITGSPRRMASERFIELFSKAGGKAK